MMKKKNYLYWLPAVIWAVIIFSMSEDPDPAAARLLNFLPNADKIGHMAEYFIFSLLIYLALVKGHALKAGSAVIRAVFLASLFGASDEFHQKFTPGRCMDIFDWLADTAGALTAHAGFLLNKISGSKK